MNACLVVLFFLAEGGGVLLGVPGSGCEFRGVPGPRKSRVSAVESMSEAEAVVLSAFVLAAIELSLSLSRSNAGTSIFVSWPL